MSCASWTIFVFSIISTALVLTTVLGCDFARLAIVTPDDFFSYSDYPQFGPWKQAIYDPDSNDLVLDGECQSWPDFFVDEFFEAPFKVSRAFSIVAAVAIGLSMVMVVLITFVELGGLKKVLWQFVRIFLSLGCVAQVAMFSLLGSEICTEINIGDQIDLFCVPGAMGIIATVNFIFLLIASIMSCCVGPPDGVIDCCGNKRGDGNDNYAAATSQEVEEEKIMHAPRPRTGGLEASSTTVEIDADGNKKTTKSVTNPDGSITTTTTMERVA